MQVGDLVKKVRGYGCDQEWLGLVIGHKEFSPHEAGSATTEAKLGKVIVMTEGHVEDWVVTFCELVFEGGETW